MTKWAHDDGNRRDRRAAYPALTDKVPPTPRADVTLGVAVGNVHFGEPVNVLLHELITCTAAQPDCMC